MLIGISVRCNYSVTDAVAQCCSSSRFDIGYETQPIDIDLFLCSGNEANLSECERTNGSSCEHTDDASVMCSKFANMEMFLGPTSSCFVQIVPRIQTFLA